jgi:hypothetical protein
MPHRLTTLALRTTTLLSSLLLVILSTVAFSYTARAFKRIATDFPPDKYWWYGPGGIDFSNYRPEEHHMVTIAYDWSTENFIWVAAGSSIVAGILGLVGGGMKRFRKVRLPNHHLSHFLACVGKGG